MSKADNAVLLKSVRRRKPRSLGDIHVRSSPTKLPPLNTTPSFEEDSEDDINVQGNALNVPPPRTTNKARLIDQPLLQTSRRKSLSPSRNNSQIEHLKKQVELLKKQQSERKIELEKSKSLVEEKQEKIEKFSKKTDKLSETIKNLENELTNYKKLLEEEKNNHNITKSSLAEQKLEMERSKEEYDIEIGRFRSALESAEIKKREELDRLTNLMKEKEAKVEQMKKHMANTLKGNSWERQQQLDELHKELQRSHDEQEEIRCKYNSLVKRLNELGDNCPRCSQTEKEVRKAQQLVTTMHVALERIDQQKFTSKR